MYKVVEEIKENFEAEINKLIDDGYWFVGEMQTSVIENEIYYSVILKK
jgi:hypothetical protein